MRVSPVSLAGSAAWTLVDGRIRHSTGGFFSVVGVRVDPQPDRGLPGVVQPIIDQPEVGLLGFVTHRSGAGLEVLVQAKPEPGNVGLVQIAPTVQATRSNFLRVHGGRPTVLLEAFGRDAPGDVRLGQSEQGSRFLGKVNDNAVTDLPDRIDEPGDEFRWCAPAGLVWYRWTGLDHGPQPTRLLRHGRGRAAREILANRTGEAMPDHTRLAGYLADPEALRVL